MGSIVVEITEHTWWPDVLIGVIEQIVSNASLDADDKVRAIRELVSYPGGVSINVVECPGGTSKGKVMTKKKDRISGQVENIVRLVYLPVNDETGEVGYDYIPYDVQEQDLGAPENELIDGWHFKPFKLIPA